MAPGAASSNRASTEGGPVACGPLEVEVEPAWPVRLPGRRAADGTTRVRGGVVERLLHVRGAPVLARAWRARGGALRIRADALDPGSVSYPFEPPGGRRAAGEDELGEAVARIRFAHSLDDDLTPFYRRFRGDALVGPVLRRRPWVRPRRSPWPWEALAWAVTKQLIEAERAAGIQRRIVRRWGPCLEWDGPLRDVPSAGALAGVAPAELVGMDLAEARALALIRCAREVASGRADLSTRECEPRLLAIREVGPWTLQCLGLYGRGDPDSLPAGDLAFVKLVGRLAGRGRRATVEEVEEYFAPYEPYRGLAATVALVGHHKRIAQGPPLRHAARSRRGEPTPIHRSA